MAFTGMVTVKVNTADAAPRVLRTRTWNVPPVLPSSAPAETSPLTSLVFTTLVSVAEFGVLISQITGTPGRILSAPSVMRATKVRSRRFPAIPDWLFP